MVVACRLSVAGSTLQRSATPSLSRHDFVKGAARDRGMIPELFLELFPELFPKLLPELILAFILELILEIFLKSFGNSQMCKSSLFSKITDINK